MLQAVVNFIDVDDAGRGLALPKLAGVAVIVVTLAHAWRTQFDAAHVSLVAMALAALFGRNVFKLFLQRASFSAAATASVARSETITHTITERRDPALGIEPS